LLEGRVLAEEVDELSEWFYLSSGQIGRKVSYSVPGRIGFWREIVWKMFLGK